MLRWVDLLPVETALRPRMLESSAVPLRRHQNLYTKLTRMYGGERCIAVGFLDEVRDNCPNFV
jgi:hypothetical protein